jgi:hypothetical protein
MIKVGWFIGLVAGCVSAVGCTSKIVVHRVNGQPPPGVTREGVYYALPKTVLLVEVPVQRARTIDGEYSDLAYLFVPFLEPVGDPAFSLDQPVLSTFGVPDATEVFLADIKGGRFEDKKLAMAFGEDGAIEKYEAESHNRTAEFVGQVLKTVGALGGKFITGGVASVSPTAKDVPSECATVGGLISDSTLTADQLPSQVVDKCKKLEPPFQKALLKYVIGDKTVADACKDTELGKCRGRARTFFRAQDAAIRLHDLRTRREALLDPGNLEAPADEPFKTMLAATDAEIAAILAEFTGTKEKKIYWKALFQITPPATLAHGTTVTIPLFSYLPAKGICPAPAAGSVPVVESLPPPDRLAACDGKPVSVQLTIRRDANQYADVVSTALTGSSPTGERGFHYRIPAKSHVVLQTERVNDKNVTVRAGVAQYSPAIAQFGVVASLPATTGGRKTQYVTELFSATGALKSFKLSSEAMIDKAIVSDIEAGATSLIDANEKRRKAEREENDELNLLKRQADILEAQVRIKAAQTALNPPAETPPEQ